MIDIFYIVLAILGLGLLVFVHELGHYFMARRVGMRVEVFSIGFGKPFYTWYRKGVKWQLCFLLLGGYVRIAGMEKEKGKDPASVDGGFFSKTPWDRIKVALAGPLSNGLIALVFFIIIWGSGGRPALFRDHTGIIGFLDKKSSLYESGVRAGDQILTYDQNKYTGYQQILEANILGGNRGELTGYKIDYKTYQKMPFDYLPVQEEFVNPSKKDALASFKPDFLPANYLLCGSPNADSGYEVTLKNSPLANFSLTENDRIIWVNGRLIFSNQILDEVLNDNKTLLTVERDGDTFLTRMPKVKIADIRLSSGEAAELADYKNAALLKEDVEKLLFIPYRVNFDGQVLDELVFIDGNAREQVVQPQERAETEIALKKGDKIVAVDGFRILSSVDIMTKLQGKKVNIIVQSIDPTTEISWKEADEEFIKSINWKYLEPLTQQIGTNNINLNSDSANYRLLPPVEPKPLVEMLDQKDLEEQRAQIEKISDPEVKISMQKELEKYQRRLGLGIRCRDLQVSYNPSPIKLFNAAFNATWKTLVSLFGGRLSPKFLTGPIGMVQIMKYSWSLGFKEALFWLGTISINLGFINLLPIPGLDGGHICFALYERLFGKKVSLKAMEKLILPFIIAIIILTLFLTYQDISRIFIDLFKR